MSLFDNQIAALLSGELFKQVLNNEQIPPFKFNIITNILVSNNIPFDVSFTSGTRKEAAALQLTIHINPTATLVLVVALEPGSNAFSPSP